MQKGKRKRIGYGPYFQYDWLVVQTFESHFQVLETLGGVLSLPKAICEKVSHLHQCWIGFQVFV